MIGGLRIAKCYLILLFCLSNCVVYAQEIYVSSSKGHDENNGLTPETPVRTIKKAISKGNTIYLAAGDVFYEYVALYERTIKRFGDGVNPEINGLRTILGRPWHQVEPHIWKINLTTCETAGFQVHQTSELNNVGCLYEVEKDCLHGRKCPNYKDLQKDWDFFQCDIQTYKLKGNSSFDELFLYYTGNPNDLVLSVSVGSHYGIALYDSSVESVNVKGFGTGGITLNGSSNVRNCRIDIIGGSMMLGGDVTCSLGNGVDFWVSRDAHDCIIEGNYISRCYDCGGSIQASKCGRATPRNIVFRDNLISHCCQGWEDFLRNDADVMFENCRFENNYIVYSGDSGFGYIPERKKYCNVLGNNVEGDRGMIIKNNTFIGGNFYCSGVYNRRYSSNVWNSNVHYVERGSYLLSEYNGTQDVLVIPSSGSYSSVIAQYRVLTDDNSTRFKVSSASKIERLSRRTIKKYLNKHSY